MTRLKAFAAVMAVAVSMVGGYEGLRLYAYRDTGGVPTICYGETRGVQMGDTATAKECADQLRVALVEYETAMLRCLTNPDDLPDEVYLSFLDLTYNIGPTAFCKSTLVKLANRGDYRGACNQMTRWVNDNGRRIQGLVNRRQATRAFCLSGLP